MHATMTAMPSAATIIAIGLARPSKRVTSPGRPNIPPPMMQLMTKAVIVQRPIDRTKAIVRLTSWSEVYHHCRTSAQSDQSLCPPSILTGTVADSEPIPLAWSVENQRTTSDTGVVLLRSEFLMINRIITSNPAGPCEPKGFPFQPEHPARAQRRGPLLLPPENHSNAAGSCGRRLDFTEHKPIRKGPCD